MFWRPVCIGLALWFTAAAAPNQLSDEEKAQGWQLLFDGKSFQGWTEKNGPLTGRYWVIDDGCLRTVASSSGHDIFTERSFRDFELSFEWKVSPAGNSGLFYNLYDIPQSPRVLRWFLRPLRWRIIGYAGAMVFAAFLLTFRRRRATAALAGIAILTVAWLGFRDYATWKSIQATAVGMEYQVLDDARHPDGARGPLYQAGSLYDLVPIAKHVVRPAGEFNQARILARGNHVEHWLNGEKVVEYELGSPDLMQRIAGSKFREMAMGAKTTGRIALQHHHDVVWFRDIKIRE